MYVCIYFSIYFLLTLRASLHYLRKLQLGLHFLTYLQKIAIYIAALLFYYFFSPSPPIFFLPLVGVLRQTALPASAATALAALLARAATETVTETAARPWLRLWPGIRSHRVLMSKSFSFNCACDSNAKNCEEFSK